MTGTMSLTAVKNSFKNIKLGFQSVVLFDLLLKVNWAVGPGSYYWKQALQTRGGGLL